MVGYLEGFVVSLGFGVLLVLVVLLVFKGRCGLVLGLAG